jgi:nucleoside-diphosphate-sugar epimerase
MKVVVTGGAGKLGQWVVQELVAAQHDVVVFDRQRGPANNGVRYLLGDIQDLGQVSGAFAGAEAVVHLAGISSHGIVANEITFQTNAVGAFNIHEAAWRLGIRRVVTMSSEAVLGWAPGAYEKLVMPDYLPIDENHPCRPQDCYGLSKVAAEAIAQSYTAKCGMETVALRPPWIVSPQELDALSQSRGMKPDNFRLYHYIDVRDLAEACRLAVERPLTGCNILFVGSGETTLSEPLASVYPRIAPQIGDMAKELTGSRAPVAIDRARRVLNWSPRHFWR